MSKFAGEYGVQFTTQLASQYTVPEIVELAELAQGQGFRQVWVTDTLRFRNVFVVLTAIAVQVPIKVGTAIMVPYFRNPVDLADTLASIAELTDGREVSVGIARGGFQARSRLQIVKPITMVRETVEMVSRLLAGKPVKFGDYPLLTSYYHLQEQVELKMAFPTQSPVRFYCGGNGPKIMEVGGRVMDGVLIGGSFIPLVRGGKLKGLLELAEAGAKRADPKKRLRKVAELNVSISRNRSQAYEFPKKYVASPVTSLERNFTPEEYRKLGLSGSDQQCIKHLKECFDMGGTVEDASKIVTDSLVNVNFLAGTPEEIVDRVREFLDATAELGFDAVSFAKLGPDYREALQLLGTEVLPKL